MADNGMITTAVDDLIRLIRDSGKLTIADAAKKLGVAEKTVSTWVDFLVEEERLSIEYKFTTPYIFLNKEYIDEEEELSISKEDFETEIKREEITIDEGEGKFHLFVSGVINQFKNIQQQIIGKKLDSAYDNYNHLSKEINNLPQSQLSDIFNRNLIQLNYQMLALYREEIEKSDKTNNQLIAFAEAGTSNLKKEEIEPAKKAYRDMKTLYDSVPTMLIDQRERFYDIIYNYFKTIVSTEKEVIGRIRSDSDKKISHIKSEINRLLHEDKSLEAEKHLITLKDIYYSLPSELIAYKLLVYNEVLRAYEEVRIAKNFESLRVELDTLGSKIKLPALSELMRAPLSSNLDAPFDKDIPTNGSPALPKFESGVPSEKLSSPIIGSENKTVTKPVEPKDFGMLPTVNSKSVSDDARVQAEIKSEMGDSKPGAAPKAPGPSSISSASLNHDLSDIKNIDPSKSPQDLAGENISSKLDAGKTFFQEKHYGKALEIYDSILKIDSENAKAKQMKDLILGIQKVEKGKDMSTSPVKA